jgi:hypothetical protein
LLFRDGDGGLERSFSDRGVAAVALKQHFAACAMQFRFERATPGAVGRRQHFVEDRKGALGVARPKYGFGQRDFQKPFKYGGVLNAQKFDAAAHAREPFARRAAFGPRPTVEKHPERAPQRKILLTRDALEFNDVRRGAREAAPHQFEHGRVHMPVGARRDVRHSAESPLSAANKRNRAFDVAQRPQRNREVEHRSDPGVMSEPKGEVVVAAWLEQRQSLFQVNSRFDILSGEPMRDTGRAMSDAGLGRIGL